MNLTELQKEAYAVAKEKGWWDQERSFGDLMALIHLELSEALEEYRQQYKWDNWSDLHINVNGKPIGVASELADVIIRVADMAEHYGWALSSDGAASTRTSFGDWIALAHYQLSQAYGEKVWYREFYLNNVVAVVYSTAAHYGIDLDAAISAKMEYNRTREYRHGGKAL